LFLSSSLVDRIFGWIVRGAGWLSVSILGLITWFVAWESLPLFQKVGWREVFGAKAWYPLEGAFQYGPMVLGSVLSAFGAVMIAVPIAFGLSLGLHFFWSRALVGVIRQILGLLVGLPSVVYGFWGLVTLVPWINQWQSPGTSLLAAILLLGGMILPTMTLMLDQSYARIDRSAVLAAHALGLDMPRTFACVVLPHTRPALGAAISISLGRALGETMAVIMVAGNIVQVPSTVFDPVRTLTANIALEMAYAMDQHKAALFFGAFLLVVLNSLVMVGGWLTRRAGEGVHA
jgi:phosphate transport system permease protein